MTTKCIIAAVFTFMGIGMIAYGIRLLIEDISKSLREDQEILKILYKAKDQIGQEGEGMDDDKDKDLVFDDAKRWEINCPDEIDAWNIGNGFAKEVALGNIEEWEINLADKPDAWTVVIPNGAGRAIACLLPKGYAADAEMKIFKKRRWWQWIIPIRDTLTLRGESNIVEMENGSGFKITVFTDSPIVSWSWWPQLAMRIGLWYNYSI